MTSTELVNMPKWYLYFPTRASATKYAKKINNVLKGQKIVDAYMNIENNDYEWLLLISVHDIINSHTFDLIDTMLKRYTFYEGFVISGTETNP